MAVQKAVAKKRGSRYKKKALTVVRKAGKYGMLRGTGFRHLRTAARSYRIPRGLSPFPNTKFVTHKYVETVYIGPGSAGLYTSYAFNANSLFDPNNTGFGHQPMFRDQMANEYSYYTVLRSSIVATIPPELNIALHAALWCDDDGALPAGNYDLMETHYFRPSIKLDKRQTPLVLKGWYDAAKWNKTTQAGIMAAPDQKVASGSNPASTALKRFNLVLIPVNGSDIIPSTPVTVQMKFYVAWREPKDHAIS